ncbi:aminoglycoside phosphotransferase [Flavobacterium rivuli WB 3.3-2 = DSM 21788]|uniref:Aminoglycoside phosphotransferase n=1 Tax=Flavobacterium rivuli WB 3.3-2 = DSM 21788 TaxID=1121895 RepID=A0A0A2M8U4_9FLAO|nr:phosphotransferase [Flavobacterium rivuli]KGO88066.1 aminoglycoside phosphotransferase [Flavobacterium rivuli WB 3.3-2 = DSM 21788]
MKNFPVTTSTLSAKDLGLFAIEKYGLGENATCTLFRTGINHTYFINDGNTKYALRVYSYNWRTELEISEEINLLNLLKQHGIGISHPIADTGRNFIQALNAPEGIRYAVLFSFAKGDKIRSMDLDTCQTIGSLMASIHSLTANLKTERINYTSESLLALPYKYATEYFSEALPEMKFIKEKTEEITDFFKQTASDIPSGIIHLDIWYDNMAVTANNEVTVFDFDFCGNGWLVFDIAYFCKQLFHIEADKDQYELKAQSFLKGYNTIRTLTTNELQVIPKTAAAIWIFYLGVQCQRFDWSNIFLTENYLKLVHVAKIKTWLEYYKTRAVTLTNVG